MIFWICIDAGRDLRSGRRPERENRSRTGVRRPKADFESGDSVTSFGKIFL